MWRQNHNMPIAELQNVARHYGTVPALRGIDLVLEPGQLLALLGANGAGKTTAVRILLGLTNPTSGTAAVFGHPPASLSAKLRRGALLQVAKVPETIRVSEHIELFSSYYPKALPFADTVAAAGLQGLENRLFGDLSGGQKQRVLFALAICGRPDLLFLDEPTVGLDVEARRTLWKYIRRFVAQGGSVLLTTHYLDEADALADRIAVIDQGRIIAEGSPSEVKRMGASTALEDAFLSLVRRQNPLAEVIQ
jgi:ABC-2 type transport system ATP-binding protein